MIKTILQEICKLIAKNAKNNIPLQVDLSRVLNHFKKLKLTNEDFNSVYIHTIVTFCAEISEPDIIQYFCNDEIIDLFQRRIFETDKEKFFRITDSVLNTSGLNGLKEYDSIDQFMPIIKKFIEYFESIVQQSGNPLTLMMYNQFIENNYKKSFAYQAEKYLDHLIHNFNNDFYEDKYITQKGEKRFLKENNNDNKYNPIKKNNITNYETLLLDPIDSYINEWINDDSQNFLAIIGEYGTGKSTLCRYIAKELSLSYKLQGNQIITDKHKRLIILLNLRNFKAESIEKFIIAELNELGIMDFNKLDLYKKIENRELIFIFDGFDEMTHKIDTEEKKANFLQIEKLINENNSKVILTTREEYFTYEKELNTVFKISNQNNYKIIYLNLFDDEQIKAYLKAHTTNYQFYLDKIKDIYDLKDLAPRPVLLEFIIRYLPDLIKGKEIDNESISINASDLYRCGIQTELEKKSREIGFLNSKLPTPKRLILLQELAKWMYLNDTLSIDTREIKESLDLFQFFDVKEDYELIKYLNMFLNFSFLIKESDFVFRISHKSFRDYLVATEMVKEINSGNLEMLGVKRTSSEINHFISEIQPNRKIMTQIVNECSEKHKNLIWLKSNLINVLLKIDNPKYQDSINFNKQNILLISRNLSNIDALKDLVNLKTLILGHNQISNIDALKDLVSLETLGLKNNQISNIDALKNLVNLKSLYLRNNQISNIDALKDLVSLESLHLDNNQISNIDALKDLVSLETLELTNNQINNIDALKNLVSLESLMLGINQISNIDALKDLVNLKSLGLGINQISNIDAFKDLVNLKSLRLKNNQISNIDAFKDLKSFKSLLLKNNQISNIDAFKDLVNLKSLRLEFYLDKQHRAFRFY